MGYTRPDRCAIDIDQRDTRARLGESTRNGLSKRVGLTGVDLWLIRRTAVKATLNPHLPFIFTILYSVDNKTAYKLSVWQLLVTKIQ